MEIKSVLDWFDLPYVEAPETARAWIESNVDPSSDSNGFSLGDLSCTPSIPDPGSMLYDLTHDSAHHALNLVLEKIDNCELFLVLPPGRDPMVPLARFDANTKTYAVNKHFHSAIAFENAQEAIKRAERNHGSLAPAPILGTKGAPAESRKAKKQASGRTGVAFLPVRYAVGRAEYREAPYSYNSPNLRTDFPELEKAYYALRTLRSGYVYVYFEDSLECFTVGTTRLKPDHKRNSGVVKASGDALIFPGDGKKKETLVAFSENEWTDDQCTKIIDNEGGCREAQMQRFSLEAPTDDSLPLADLATQVEEYAGVSGKYDWWTEHRSFRNYDAGERMSELRASAGSGQHVIVLHDPAGITHELSNLVDEEIDSLRRYTTSPTDEESKLAEAEERRERHRKKIIADYIERLYVGRYIQPGRFEKGETQDEAIEKLAKLRQETVAAQVVYQPMPSVTKVKQDITSDAINSHEAADLREHVDEEGRQNFLNEYESEVERRHERIKASKRDRLAWLSTEEDQSRPDALGTAWARYDMADREQSLLYELSFARATTGMTAIALPADEMRKEPEFKLLSKWLESSPDESPLIRALMGDEGLKELSQTLEENISRGADMASGIATLIEEINKKYPITPASLEICNNITTYVLDKADAFGAGMTKREVGRMESSLRRAANTNDKALLLRILGARAGLFLKPAEVRLETVLRDISDASEVPGGLKPDELVTKHGNLNKGVTIVELTEASSGRAEPNPFRGTGSLGSSGIVGFLNLINLKNACAQIEREINWENRANLWSAVSGLTASLLEFMQAARELSWAGKATKSIAGGGLKGTSKRLVTKLLDKLLAKAVSRMFGYAAAALTFITDAIKAIKQMRQGQWKAGLFYAASGLTAGAGSSAMITAGGLLVASNPVGWLVLVVGILLVGVSVLFATSAENAIAKPLEKWLDSGIFGLHKLDWAKDFTNLAEEQAELMKALYSPVVLDTDFDIWHDYDYGDSRVTISAYTAEFTIFLPGYRPGQSELDVKSTAPGRVRDWGSNDGSRYSSGGALVHYRHFIPKEKYSKWVSTYTVSYLPSKEFKQPFTETFQVEHAAHFGIFE